MLYSLLTNILTLIMAILGTIGAVWRYLVEVAFTRGMNWRSVRKKQVGPFLLCPTLYCYRRCWYKGCRPVEKDGQPNLSETSQQQKDA